MAEDPRDDEFVRTVSSAVVGMMRAVHHGDRLRLIGELSLLLNSMIEHDAVVREHPQNESLRRAVARLCA